MILRICHLQAGAWEGNNNNGKEDYHLRQWCSKYKTEKASITANYAGREVHNWSTGVKVADEGAKPRV